ncbi:MAG: hypothetical protein K1X90_08210 [Candidatus Kapabacteria bacterium]|nr:hypothetical protein [Candidatus Kapabacteria bacterium]
MKHTYKWSASALLFTFSIWIFSGCGGHPPIAPGIPGDIAFNLLIPSNTPKGDYQAISGLSVAQTSTKVGDTTLTSISRSFYGQFTGTPLPGNVLLNNVPLARYRTSDTLRLNNGDATIFGPNTWAFVDTLTGDTARFPAIMVDPIDTVGPFTTDNFIRADTTLRLAWRPPTNGSGGVLITWVAPDTTLQEYVQDVGFATLAPFKLKSLIGKGTVTLTRFRNDQRTWNGKKVIITRLAECRYVVTLHS